jgi:hypothetical protein
MASYVKTKIELQQELHEQVAALRASSTNYDSGARWEAKRLATTTYILLNDGGRNNKALLTQLELKEGMSFISTVKLASADGESPLPLATILIRMAHGDYSYEPFLDGAINRREMSFSKWYSEAVFFTGNGKALSRKNLIFSLRNQMGGSHVDPTIKDEAFHWLTRGAHTLTPSPITDEEGNVTDDIAPFAAMSGGAVPNGHFATMRQIAWELDASLIRAGY